jgi:hypothetical protein
VASTGFTIGQIPLISVEEALHRSNYVLPGHTSQRCLAGQYQIPRLICLMSVLPALLLCAGCSAISSWIPLSFRWITCRRTSKEGQKSH